MMAQLNRLKFCLRIRVVNLMSSGLFIVDDMKKEIQLDATQWFYGLERIISSINQSES